MFFTTFTTSEKYWEVITTITFHRNDPRTLWGSHLEDFDLL